MVWSNAAAYFAAAQISTALAETVTRCNLWSAMWNSFNSHVQWYWCPIQIVPARQGFSEVVEATSGPCNLAGGEGWGLGVQICFSDLGHF